MKKESAAKTKKKEVQIEAEVPTLNIKTMRLVLIGDSPLIVHAWSDKAKKMMLEKQQKKAPKGKEIRDPEKDFQEALYKMPDGGYGFPAIAFKAAAVTVCSQIDGISKVFARQTFHVGGDDLVRIYGDEPVMREDMVRVGMGTADLRFRPEFKNWYVKLDVDYNASAISEVQLKNIFNTSGFGVGIGEWRPEKDGRNGRFHVATEKEISNLPE
jgi:hypothetical protein